MPKRGELRRIERAHGEIDKRHTRIEFGNGGDDEYQDNWGIRLGMYGTQEKRSIHQVG